LYLSSGAHVDAQVDAWRASRVHASAFGVADWKTVEQTRLANALCRFAELAERREHI
jgi:hypothetical protein